jgi:hypothetical protein
MNDLANRNCKVEIIALARLLRDAASYSRLLSDEKITRDVFSDKVYAHLRPSIKNALRRIDAVIDAKGDDEESVAELQKLHAAVDRLYRIVPDHRDRSEAWAREADAAAVCCGWLYSECYV